MDAFGQPGRNRLRDVPGDVLRRRIDPVERHHFIEIASLPRRQYAVEPLMQYVEVAQQPILVKLASRHDHAEVPPVQMAGLAVAADRDRVVGRKVSFHGHFVHRAEVYPVSR